MTLLSFLFNAVVISLSGVMMPGAVTAATLAQGTCRPQAGSLIAIGHGLLEIPLIFLMMLGLYVFLDDAAVKTAVGFIGGVFLVWMSWGMLRELKKPDFHPQTAYQTGPVATGFLLSATNPYFLLWWATVGLNLALKARELGTAALVLFAGIHWLCDFVWLTILSVSAFYGANLLSDRNQKWILAFCALTLAGFGIYFIIDAL